jgi:hypothetical protein
MINVGRDQYENSHLLRKRQLQKYKYEKGFSTTKNPISSLVGIRLYFRLLFGMGTRIGYSE